MPISVMIVDDHAVVRDGLAMLLNAQSDMVVVGVAIDGREAIELAALWQPDVIIMDIAMPSVNGLEAMERIRQRSSAAVIFLSMHSAPEYVARSVRNGARGYLLKQSTGTELTAAIRIVAGGGEYFGKGVVRPSWDTGPDSEIPAGALPLLSSRELTVLSHVVEGRTSAEIGALLYISPKTVDTYRQRLMQKLDVNNLATLIRVASREQLIPDP